MALYIDFDWSMDTKGYRLDGRRIVGNGGPRKSYRPLDQFPTLYSVFAQIPQTADGALYFVQRFGRLTADDLGTDDPGDKVSDVIGAAQTMALALSVGRLPKWTGPTEYEVPGTNLIVTGGIPVGRGIQAWLAPDPTTGEWRLKLTPKDLLGALRLQSAQALIDPDSHMRECIQCGGWFTGRRTDAKFCSDECRIQYNSLKRSRP
jgi:predicted nucleic acid-binding Zn ribbon protein